LHRIAIGFGAASLVSLGVLLSAKILWVVTIFQKPGEMISPAAANVYIARRVQQGGKLYGDWRRRPHVPTWYGPALYLPPAYIGRWVHADVPGLYLIGRGISLLATVGVIGLILSVAARKSGGHPIFGWMMSAAFVTADEILAFFDMAFRADAPSSFFTLLGLVAVWMSNRPGARYGSILIFGLAFLYKQTSVVGPLAVVLWLGFTGRRKDAIRYAAICGAGLLAYLVLMEVCTHGRFSLNSVQALRANTTLRTIPFMLFEVVRPTILPMSLAFFVLITEWIHRRWDLLTIAFAVSVVLTAASTYRDGSSINYYMLPLAIACLLAARRLGGWWRERYALPAATGLAFAMILAAVRYVPQAAVCLLQFPARWQTFQSRHEQNREKADFLRQLSNYLNQLPGPVLCQFNDLVLYCPRSILVDTCTFSGMADVGVFDDRELIEQLRRGEVAAIVFDPKMPKRYHSTDGFSQRWLQAMEGRYERVARFKWAEIYRPIERPRDAPEADGSPGG